MDIYEQLERDEGCVLHAYKDSLGFDTIGVGHLIDARRGGGITRAQALSLLTDDVSAKQDELFKALPWAVLLSKTDGVRYAVLLNMAYNLGVPGLLGFNQFLGAMQQHNWGRAAQEMEASDWWSQVGDRAKRLQQQVLSGEWR